MLNLVVLYHALFSINFWELRCVFTSLCRWSPTRSYADPKQSFVDQGNVSASAAETCPSIPNGNITPQKKS